MAGIQIRLDPSWLVIFALVLWSLSAGYLPHAQPGEARAAYWLAGLVSTLLFFGSVLLHELSHSALARREGVAVPSITLFLFGGAAEAAEEPRSPSSELRIALAGPAMSFALAGVFEIVAHLFAQSLVVAVLHYLAGINLALGVFNLLPGLPLDGGRVLRALLWRRLGSHERASRIASQTGQGLGIGLAALGAIQLFGGNLLGGIWLVLIGLFLRGVAYQSYRESALRGAISNLRVGDVMARELVTVPPDLSVHDLIEEFIMKTGHPSFPVVEGGRVLGVVSLETIREVPRERRGEARVRDCLEPAPEQRRIAPDAPLSEALARMAETGARRLLVIDASGALAGFVTHTGVALFLELEQVLPRPARSG